MDVSFKRPAYSKNFLKIFFLLKTFLILFSHEHSCFGVLLNLNHTFLLLFLYKVHRLWLKQQDYNSFLVQVLFSKNLQNKTGFTKI